VFTVTLRLPELAEAQVAHDVLALDTVTGYEGARRVVLVADDSAENRGVIREMLAPLGFQVVEVGNGEDALRTAQAHKPDVVVMDLVLPGMDGRETARRLRELPGLGDTVILASSAHVSKEQHALSTQHGCNDFLPKPVEASALLDQIGRHLGLRWLHKTQATPSAAPEPADADLCRPSRDRIAMLLDLAIKGRMQDLVDQVNRLCRDDTRLQPWALRVCALADTFELKKLRSLLQSDLDAATRT
jgi:CheY-like chemotaxis protein